MSSYTRPPRHYAFPPDMAEETDAEASYGQDWPGYDRPGYDQPAGSAAASEVDEPTHSWLNLDLVPSWLRPFTLDANTRFTRTPDHFLRPRDVVVAALSCEISNRGWRFVLDPADDLTASPQVSDESGIIELPDSATLAEAAAAVSGAPHLPAMWPGPDVPAAAELWGGDASVVTSVALLPDAATEALAEQVEAPAPEVPVPDASLPDATPAAVFDGAAAAPADAPAALVSALESDLDSPLEPVSDAPVPEEDAPAAPALIEIEITPGEPETATAQADLAAAEAAPLEEAPAVDAADHVPETLLAVGRLLLLGAAAAPPEAAADQDRQACGSAASAGAAGAILPDASADDATGTTETGADAEVGDLGAEVVEDHAGFEDEAGDDLAEEDVEAEADDLDLVAADDEETSGDDEISGDDDALDEAEDDEDEDEDEGEGEAIMLSDVDEPEPVAAASSAPSGDPSDAAPATADGPSHDPWPAVWRPYQQMITARFLGAAAAPGLAAAASATPAAPAVPLPVAAASVVDESVVDAADADGADDAPEGYQLPPIDLLREPPVVEPDFELSEEFLDQSSTMLQQVLRDFGVRGEVIDANPGPVVTLYEFEPAPGVKSSRVIGLSPDIARSMSAVSTRVAVVEGRNVIGIELPNRRRETVWLRELLASQEFSETHPKLGLCLGKTIGGVPIIADLARMPHLLVAGTTGSGKSVAINTMILSLLYRHTPEACRLIMIDPKMLELSVYEGIPHLLTPVVTDPKKAIIALKWAVKEMEERYKKMSRLAVRNIDGFNARVKDAAEKGEVITRQVQVGFDKESGEALFEEQAMDLTPLPYIVVIVDEMADLMMVAGKEIEGAIQRLAQMARAAGIHLVMATQRPSVDVITGTIKANFPTRISFQVTSKIDSRTILGEMGAETLLGQGDMLFMAGGGRITRVHGPFVSDGEVEKVVAFLKAQGKPDYLDEVILDEAAEVDDEDDAVFDRSGMAEVGGDLYEQAVAIVMRDRKASTSYIQRRLQVGYNKAASLMERMETEGIVGPANHAGKREILTFSRPD
ncbi:DNA translocase FtsK [Xanthobacter dioxanivorans]|uniref:DNA translocase FtsK n=1 Tax=Xanthobacter dioxanivorans TaxID=2528964 RepID=UPI001E4C05CC|nr:DNA translocase FtsK [Xanthobacter dioxanivorans]